MFECVRPSMPGLSGQALESAPAISGVITGAGGPSGAADGALAETSAVLGSFQCGTATTLAKAGNLG